MNHDIVTRLRVHNHHAKKLAENESLSDLHRDAFMRCEDLTWLAADRIEKLLEDTERLRKERDEARREAMSWFIDQACRSEDVDEEYKKRGWEYLKENTNGEQK